MTLEQMMMVAAIVLILLPSIDICLYFMIRQDLPDRLWPPHAKWMRKQGGDDEC